MKQKIIYTISLLFCLTAATSAERVLLVVENACYWATRGTPAQVQTYVTDLTNEGNHVYLTYAYNDDQYQTNR
jgi:hypothetical protein